MPNEFRMLFERRAKGITPLSAVDVGLFTTYPLKNPGSFRLIGEAL